MTHRPPDRPAYDPWAAYYDLTDRDTAPAIAFYGGLVGPQTRHVLELGCGTGSITVAVAAALGAGREGARVVGLDESEEMLAVARERDDTIHWVHGDMRAPGVDGPFDLVFCCFNTLQLLPDDDSVARTLAAARALLGDGGVFAFDLANPKASYLGSPYRDRVARAVTSEDGRRLETREDARYDEESRILTLDWRLVDTEAPERDPLTTASFGLRQYPPDEMLRLVADAGLRVTERYGDLDRSPFSADAKQQVLVCAAA